MSRWTALRSPRARIDLGSLNQHDNDSERSLAKRLEKGDEEALAALFSLHRGRLEQVARLRLDPRLIGRVDSDDVLQEAWLAAISRLTHFDHRSLESPFLWLRMILGQTLADVHRHHLGTLARDAAREVRMPDSHPGGGTEDRFWTWASVDAAAHRVEHEEVARELAALIRRLAPIDREILLLRHFEQLTNAEVANSLGLSRTAASNRYVRAVARLRDLATRDRGLNRPLEVKPL